MAQRGVLSTEADPGRGARLHSIKQLRRLIWIYLFLLIFEGSFRKWVPGLSAPFLLIRDPFALAIWIRGAKLGFGDKRAWTAFYLFAFSITVLGLLQIMGAGLGPLVFLYGWRSYVLHIPVAIVVADLFDFNDLYTVAKRCLIMSIPMTLLMIAEYQAPPGSFINRGSSGEGGQITGALGHIRPAGTFSFITGPAQFYPIAAAFVLWGYFQKDLFPKWLLMAAAVSIVLAAPVSVSRSVLISVVLVVLNGVIGEIVAGRSSRFLNIHRLAISLLVGAGGIFGLMQVPVFQDSVTTFSTRWVAAQGGTGDNSKLQERVVGGFGNIARPFQDLSMLGKGIGRGSTVVASLEDEDALGFGEDPQEREINELGSIAGPLFIIGRAGIALMLIWLSFRSLRAGPSLAWLLLPMGVIDAYSMTIDQATIQGFTIISVGIVFAASRRPNRELAAHA
ncbi:hypothetical protein [Terriglobus saanensis]|uniref:Membrane protein n=1 Tax=Terriglobus saanensis (strain ATCC BAA-1853 / DSM 23119 / SP1PR4) TaxID=401053 RepID=E8UZD9_TERSS|nr:hypothetical protein [Terriglobus saanensis]ADV83219.1 membrane protein [Terriglobus saanensis SP1PR4]